MDGSLERSDSESGDSWTLLEHTPLHAEDAPDLAELPLEGTAENQEKDEDTDGISIISDSEPDSPSPCQLYEHYLPDDDRPTEHEITQCISANQPLIDINDHDESVRDKDDFLYVDSMKHRTYVHRRNKRLSTMLNIIVLGSVITAAGVAIGHMWGAKTDCSMHTTPTVNKILSNLYKLQEENAYLRSKLKEMTALSSYQINLQKNSKQNRCRKMFEESLNNDNIDKLTKCLDNKFDNSDKYLKNHLVEPNYEKEFISDLDKLKNVYLQNKSWLDEEINQRLKQEEESLKKLKNKHISKLHKINEEKNTNIIDDKDAVVVNDMEIQNESIKSDDIDKKVTYADSLKSTEKMKKVIDIIDNNKTYKAEKKDINYNKNIKGSMGPIFDYSVSEEELKKDNRYKSQKYKPEKKKHDRQKSHKKQKRKNKYEQWEMKGGFMKDYDEISFTSSQDAENVNKNENLKYDVEENINITRHNDNTKVDKKADTIGTMAENFKTKLDKDIKEGKLENEVEDNTWLEKRATLRTEARKRLEHELFGESPNTAGWYFRRMRKREQCRAKGDNSTYRKLLKRNMNFKIKH